MTSYPSKVTALYEKIKDYKIEINRIINNHYDNIRRNFEYGFYPKNDLEIYLFENCKLEDFRDYKSWKDCNKTKLSEIK